MGLMRRASASSGSHAPPTAALSIQETARGEGPRRLGLRQAVRPRLRPPRPSPTRRTPWRRTISRTVVVTVPEKQRRPVRSVARTTVLA